MEKQIWKPPEWWYIKKRPTNDNEYLENMSRVIFQAGLNWTVVDKKWTAITEAFKGFSVEKVASFTDSDA